MVILRTGNTSGYIVAESYDMTLCEKRVRNVSLVEFTVV